MSKKTLLQIREFSLMTGIRKENLRFYDNEGLLSPEMRGDNGYRYYTQHQLDTAFLISDLRALGISLPEIKRYADKRSPERMLELFKEQDSHIETEIAHLRTLQELMRLRADLAKKALQYKENTVVLEEMKREPIFLCPLHEDLDADDKLIHCYDDAAAHGADTHFPLGAIIPHKIIEEGDWIPPSQYYFKVRKPRNSWISAGTYAVFYGKWTDNSTENFYGQLLSYIHTNKLHILGDAYEEYMLDELSTREGDAYVKRVAVRVEG